jgi:HSP20 family molecular chaperone IbpA
MQNETRGTSTGKAGSTRLLSTEELFQGFNELYESVESDAELAGASAPSQAVEVITGTPGGQAAHLEITESGDAFNVRAELPSFDPEPAAAIPVAVHAVAAHAPGGQAPRKTRKRANPVLRAIDMLADADRENITATLKGGMLEVKLPKSRVESLAAARSALLASVATGRPRGA